MKTVFVFTFVLIAAAYGAEICCLFSAPGPEVSGLASGGGLLWILDPFNDVIFGMSTDYPGPSVVDVIDVPFDDASNLAYAEGKLYLTEGNSTVIHSVTVEGEIWSSADVSGLGIQSIDDLGFEAHFYGACMLLLDGNQETVFNIFPLDAFSSGEIHESVAGAPQCLGIAGTGGESGDQGIWIASGSEYESLQMWLNGSYSYGWHTAEAENVTEIAQDEWEYPGEFMWLYDQSSNQVMLRYYGVALDRSTWAEIKASLPDR